MVTLSPQFCGKKDDNQTTVGHKSNGRHRLRVRFWANRTFDRINQPAQILRKTKKISLFQKPAAALRNAVNYVSRASEHFILIELTAKQSFWSLVLLLIMNSVS